MVGQFQRFDRTNKNAPTRKDTNMKQAKPATRSLSLPKPIAAYFAAYRGDGEVGGDGFWQAERSCCWLCLLHIRVFSCGCVFVCSVKPLELSHHQSQTRCR